VHRYFNLAKVINFTNNFMDKNGKYAWNKKTLENGKVCREIPK
jgi:hypothetical protein